MVSVRDERGDSECSLFHTHDICTAFNARWFVFGSGSGCFHCYLLPFSWVRREHVSVDVFHIWFRCCISLLERFWIHFHSLKTFFFSPAYSSFSFFSQCEQLHQDGNMSYNYDLKRIWFALVLLCYIFFSLVLAHNYLFTSQCWCSVWFGSLCLGCHGFLKPYNFLLCCLWSHRREYPDH